MKRSGFKWKPQPFKVVEKNGETIMYRNGFIVRNVHLKKSPLKRRSKIRLVSDSDSALKKKDIQALLRLVVTIRDGGCILRNLRHCNGAAVVEGDEIVSDVVIQADHLVSRANSSTYADSRLVVCLCRGCHAWKSVGNNLRKAEYDELVKTILPPHIVSLWDRCEQDFRAHKAYKVDWNLAIIALKQELEKLRKSSNGRTLAFEARNGA